MLDLLGTLEAAELPNGDRLVAAHGPLDERTAGELSDVLLPLAYGERHVILDLADAHGVDTRALAVVACAAELLTERGTHLALVTRSPVVRRLVDDAGILDLVRFHPTLAEAMHVD